MISSTDVGNVVSTLVIPALMVDDRLQLIHAFRTINPVSSLLRQVRRDVQSWLVLHQMAHLVSQLTGGVQLPLHLRK